MAMANDKMKDVYFVSSSDKTPHFKKMKDMFLQNGWTFTSKVDAPLGEPVMNNAEEAVCTHKHIVVLFDKGDCIQKFGEYNMTMEMAFLSLRENEIGRKIIPIRCCDEKLVPLRLRCLRGRAINDDDLEEKMKQAIGKRIKIEREAQLCSVSGEQTLTSGTDEMDVGNGRFPLLRNILTNEYFMDLAQEIGTEWKDLALRLEFSKAEIERIEDRERDIKYRTLEILQCWHQRTSNVKMGRKVEILCKSLLKCGREDLSDKVKADAEHCS
ncbi:uncharacterized protein LOC129257079 [Lytechinus pictus]|uniref:uncharacterized protein LOC129257079 n=1 Tax=Lytechinus pictus TaxID=7653 RepID=UPI0030B9C381